MADNNHFTLQELDLLTRDPAVATILRRLLQVMGPQPSSAAGGSTSTSSTTAADTTSSTSSNPPSSNIAEFARGMSNTPPPSDVLFPLPPSSSNVVAASPPAQKSASTSTEATASSTSSDVSSPQPISSASPRILFLGLDNAGKTTLIGMLKTSKISAHTPTNRTGEDDLVVGNLKIKAFDMGGHEAAREHWRTYFCQVDAIVYLVDTFDIGRLPEAKKELDQLLAEEQLAQCPFLILGNKMDVARVTEHELRAQLGLLETTGKDVSSIPKDSGIRPCEVFMCSLKEKVGFQEGFRWLSNLL